MYMICLFYFNILYKYKCKMRNIFIMIFWIMVLMIYCVDFVIIKLVDKLLKYFFIIMDIKKFMWG